jgi:hypothetical protein
VKLFQIEEPDGSPLEAEGPGAAVGIHLADQASVAHSLGGNPEILGRAEGSLPKETLLALRSAAEKLLARPVTHAVIAAAGLDDELRAVIAEAGDAAGLVVLRIMAAAEAVEHAPDPAAADGAVLGAAIVAEDLAAPA